MIPPFNFQKWVTENAHRLQPPVNNFCLWDEKDFTVMCIGGPNKRRDYHINVTEEFFYQTKGDMILKTVQDGQFIVRLSCAMRRVAFPLTSLDEMYARDTHHHRDTIGHPDWRGRNVSFGRKYPPFSTEI